MMKYICKSVNLIKKKDVEGKKYILIVKEIWCINSFFIRFYWFEYIFLYRV